MSGHSKWSQIKHKKAVTDAKRGALFGKLARAITVAAKDNPDPETNNRLKDEITHARAANMPSDNIERALKRVSEKDAVALTELQMEFLGPGNVALIVTAITDSRNRTIGELKTIAARHGGSLAAPGSISWMFSRTGIITASLAEDLSDELQLRAIDAGATEVQYEQGALTILTAPEALSSVAQALSLPDAHLSVTLLPITPHPLPDLSDQRALEKLIDHLDEHEDTQTIITNAEY